KPRAIAKKLKLDEEQVRELKRAIKRLVKLGQIAYGANHLVGPAVAPKSGSGGAGYRVTGVFRRAEKGFGFVRAVGSAHGAERTQDIFIAADDAGDAATGDAVLVRLKKKSDHRRPNPEGDIVEVIERETHNFV